MTPHVSGLVGAHLPSNETDLSPIKVRAAAASGEVGSESGLTINEAPLLADAFLDTSVGGAVEAVELLALAEAEAAKLGGAADALTGNLTLPLEAAGVAGGVGGELGVSSESHPRRRRAGQRLLMCKVGALTLPLASHRIVEGLLLGSAALALRVEVRAQCPPLSGLFQLRLICPDLLLHGRQLPRSLQRTRVIFLFSFQPRQTSPSLLLL